MRHKPRHLEGKQQPQKPTANSDSADSLHESRPLPDEDPAEWAGTEPEIDGEDSEETPVAGAKGRMVPLSHSGPLPWVQLRNVVYGTSVFRKMIGRIANGLRAGDMVSVYDRDGVPFGTAIYNSQAPIALRMIEFGAASVDESFLEQRLERAVHFRRQILKLDACTNAYRITHAEGDGLPGLIIDRLGDTAVVEFFSLAMHRRRERIEKSLLSQLDIKRVIFRADTAVQATEGFFMPAAKNGPVAGGIITENGLRFAVDPAGGHKTGFFCDQRDNRRRLTRFTVGGQVLDLCCYSGGFGIYAAALGNAANVTAVDLDENAVDLARRNANLNKISAARYQTVHADSFPYLRQMKQNGRTFDTVILDPPKLIPQRADFADGRQAYFDLNKLAMGVVRPGGLLATCSCSGLLDISEFMNVLKGAARSAQRRVQIIQITGPGPDHPVMTEFLEGLYLKCIWCRIW